MEADVSVQVTRPTSPDLKTMKIGRLHVMPFAAKAYLDLYGTPKNIPDLLRHRIVLQIADQLTSQAEYDALFPGVPQPGFVAIRTNAGSAHYWSIAKGAGIGMLPTYAAAIGAQVVPLDIGLYRPVDIWLAYHPDAGRIPRVRRMLDWIIDSFDPKKFPWFRDEFIHPRDLPDRLEGEAVVNLFAGFGGHQLDERGDGNDRYYGLTG
jgi:DNA-binding transcriptional LysR family regulator